MSEAAELIGAISQVLWPLLLAWLIYMLRHNIPTLLGAKSEIALEFMGNKFVVKPSEAVRIPTEGDTSAETALELSPVESRDPMPADYYFINHTSFLRPKKQEEFQARTGVKRPHYDIRVIVDSYYCGALERIKQVEYILHQAYPGTIQIRSQAKNKFLLKELANGEYVLLAKVYLKDRKVPVILQRYITLWKEGPRLDVAKAV